ncbi:MAG: 1-acyl-sn-glycerol-3-phosphate acyltransferase [Clostridia bacterium]|nr:1-acyl-sn-glycerol-3-phosphate acyltransferase [Clostridia bacterium]
MKKVIYYSDELNNDFAGTNIKAKPLGKNFKFIKKNPLWILLSFILRCFVIPIAFLYCKIKFRYKIINKKALKECKRSGYFLYGNHTQHSADAFIPSLIAFPKRTFIITSLDAVSVPGLRQVVLMLGAIPIPNLANQENAKNFLEAIEKRNVQGHCLAIYPEAHIWPYYTKIRNYKSVSFKYPVRLNEPSYCFTTTYQKRKDGKRPRITIYIDGPFYPKTELNPKEQQEELRNRIHNTMVMRSEENNYEFIEYVYKKNIKE